jgi:hypothetical protein
MKRAGGVDIGGFFQTLKSASVSSEKTLQVSDI